MLEIASQILQKTYLGTQYGSPLQLKLVETIYDYDNAPSTLFRCEIEDVTQTNSLPKTVIIKRFNEVNDSLFYELISLEFLNTLALNITPQLYAYDVEKKIIILEDLGDAVEYLLGNIFFGVDRLLAENALVEFNKTLANLHLASHNKQTLWKKISAKHSNPTHVSRHRINHIVETMQDLPTRFQEIAIKMSDNAKNDLNYAKNCIENPQQFLAFVHGDTTPANAFYVDGNIRLFDFETSDFRHCLLDGSYSRMRYLHSVWAHTIPLDIQQKSMEAYRNTFLAGSSVDEATFDYHLMASCTAWLAGLFALLPAAVEKDKRWGRSTYRQRIISGLEHFVVIADELNHFQDLRNSCLEVEQKLREQWSEDECTMLVYPAFDENEQ